MKNGDLCACVDDVKNSTSVDECRMNCSGNPNQYCGGLETYSVYTGSWNMQAETQHFLWVMMGEPTYKKTSFCYNRIFYYSV